MTWWMWWVAGLGLGIIEVLAPGYVFLGFAVAAGVMGLLALAGVSLSLPAALAALAVMALGAWAVLHRLFPIESGSVKRIERDINEN